ncbi:DUF2505 family protein [Brevibacterium sp. Marseille-P9724]|uniref:DUF2505 family protein n=1 Tax=Brevibacterium sp. Marseille-P9724 TaxID=2614125 RepID=UPI0009F69844|nr:DUF2505 family protein [Brevibacterium sp. Marseille-P9724]
MKKIRVSERLRAETTSVRSILASPHSWQTAEGSTATAEAGDAGTVVRARASLASFDLPDAAAAFVSKAANLEQTITVPDAFPDEPAAYAAEIPGVPLRITADVTAEGLGDGHSLITVDAEAESSVPLLGGMIEEAAAAAVERVFRDRLASIAKAG